MQFDAAPLEAAFLQNVARGWIGDPRPGDQMFDIELLEGEINHRARRFSAKTLAPMLDAEPVAEFASVGLRNIRRSVSRTQLLASRNVGVGMSCSMSGSCMRKQNAKLKREAGFPPPLWSLLALRRFIRNRRTRWCPPFTRPQLRSSEAPRRKCDHWLLHE